MKKAILKSIPTLSYEKELWNSGYKYVLGLDEAGRGAWAGCVVVGAVMFFANDWGIADKLLGVNDSKQLTAIERYYWAKIIKEQACEWSVGWASEKEIDHYGIKAAVQLASIRAIFSLRCFPQFLLIDYYDLPFLKLPQLSIVKGDSRSLTIAAASIIAKTCRDEMMEKLADKYPEYGFEKHKGYGTRKHRNALLSYGATDVHRMSYSPLKCLDSSSRV